VWRRITLGYSFGPLSELCDVAFSNLFLRFLHNRGFLLYISYVLGLHPFALSNETELLIIIIIKKNCFIMVSDCACPPGLGQFLKY
jgi:hypothetical protein